MKTIDKLTPEQEALIPVVRDKWIEIGLSTSDTPPDILDLKPIIDEVYNAGGLKPPKYVIMATDPLDVVRIGAILVLKKGNVEEPPSREKILAHAKEFSEDQIKTKLRELINSCVYGNQDVAWLAFFDYFHQIGIEECTRLNPLMELSKRVSWYLPMEDIIILSPLPSVLKIENGNLSCRNGPALKYGDTFEVYAIEGIVLPKKAIMAPETLTLDEVKNEPNQEVRRLLRNIYGDGRYLKDIKAKVIDADYEGAKKGAAPRMLVEDNEGRRWFIGTDGSTTRTYYMEVENTIKTCKEAHSYLCGFDESRIVNKS